MAEPSPEWLAEHDRYLASVAWDERRSAVLLRDKYHCQAHLDGCVQKATQVHHLTYRHWRNEPLFDLTSVCWNCHQEITDMERGKLADIVARKDAEHDQFMQHWNAALAARLKR